MHQLNWRSLLFVLPALLPLAACSSTGKASQPDAKPAAESPGGDDGEKGGAEEKQRKRERALTYARLELKIARLEAEAADRESKDAVADAERELRDATLDRDRFQSFAKAFEEAQSQLEIDQSKQRHEENRQELDELLAMYKQEELAALTKELVISRGKAQLELAARRLELALREDKEMRDHQHPKKLRELEQKVAEAEIGLREAKAKQAKQASEKELALLKAQHEVEDAERELAEAKDGKEKPKA
ncbi:MAG: hypothetical protein ACKVWV_03385 [Planctomycetota bacterium]